MEVTGSGERVRAACDAIRGGGVALGSAGAVSTVGFVPTMGFLHEGHLSLVRAAREECPFVVVSIFVNPLQFGPKEDLASYPRDLDRDLAMLEEENVDLVFTPDAEEMYPEGAPAATVDPGPLGDILEGASRPGHFRGVCTVVAELFGIVGPCDVWFGQKDAQQLAVIRRMVANLNLPVEVHAGDTVREPDGLAMSSRNTHLSPEERKAATCLYRALRRAHDAAAHGEREANVLRAEMAKIIGAEPLARIEYIEVVDDVTFEPPAQLDALSRALVAARVGSTRLIDNMPLP